MGLFKSFKGMKELGDYHGGMPTFKDTLKTINAVTDDRGQGEILKHGTPTSATVQGFPMPIPGDQFAMQVPLDVKPPGGGAPYRVDYVFPTARMKAPITAGMEVPVKVDPADPLRIAVQWDAQKAEIAAAGGDMAAVQAGFANTYYATAADTAMRQATGGPGAGATDPAEKIAKLAQLRDAGAITEDEFQAKKAQLLAEL